jgi:hypothetical protein
MMMMRGGERRERLGGRQERSFSQPVPKKLRSARRERAVGCGGRRVGFIGRVVIKVYCECVWAGERGAGAEM